MIVIPQSHANVSPPPGQPDRWRELLELAEFCGRKCTATELVTTKNITMWRHVLTK